MLLNRNPGVFRMSKQSNALSVLMVSTLAFTVCFMVWMMFGVIGIPLKKQLGLNATEFGLLTAMPVLVFLRRNRCPSLEWTRLIILIFSSTMW